MAEDISADRLPTTTLEIARVNNFDILCSGSLANITQLPVHAHGIGQTASTHTQIDRYSAWGMKRSTTEKGKGGDSLL